MAEDGKGKGVKEEKIAEIGIHLMKVDSSSLFFSFDSSSLFSFDSSFRLPASVLISNWMKPYEIIEDAWYKRLHSRPERLIQERLERSRLLERFVRMRAMQRSERPCKRQKLEEEGELSAMGAATSTPTVGISCYLSRASMAEDGKGKGVKEEKIAEDGIHAMKVDFTPLNDAQFLYLLIFLWMKTCKTIEDALDEIELSRPERLIQERLVNSVPLRKALSSLADRYKPFRAMQRSERPCKKQKLEDGGESSVMGAMGAATSTPTADGDALKVLAFEQRIRDLESQVDAFKCAYEKEKAAHYATMRLLRALQHAVEAVPRQVTTDEPEARLLQDTTEEPEHLELA